MKSSTALRLLAACALGWMPIAAATAQTTQASGNLMPGSDFIASRQTETAEIARLIYRVRFDDGSWTHQQVAVCPAFPHYAFARYTQRMADGRVASFLATYALDNPPARTLIRPWQGGILLLQANGARDHQSPPLAEHETTITLFNRIWEDELSRSGESSAFPALSWQGLADCYARFADEQPQNPALDDSATPRVNLKETRVSTAMIMLQTNGLMDLSLALGFDRHGLITSASLNRSQHVN